jgi:stalled ribosome rescue protein Dom34
MPHFHAVAWIDHREAKIFHITETEADKHVVHAPGHLQHHQGVRTGKHGKPDEGYLNAVCDALKGAQEWLILGPGSAKDEFGHHLDAHAPELKSRVLGIEAADHPSDGEIVAHARRFFIAKDRMRPQPGAPRPR